MAVGLFVHTSSGLRNRPVSTAIPFIILKYLQEIQKQNGKKSHPLYIFVNCSFKLFATTLNGQNQKEKK
jgi:hypothetical protein